MVQVPTFYCGVTIKVNVKRPVTTLEKLNTRKSRKRIHIMAKKPDKKLTWWIEKEHLKVLFYEPYKFYN